MKKYLLSLVFLSLSACAVTPSKQQVEIAFLSTCATYGVGFNGALQLRQMGKLSPAEIDQITVLSHTISPLCETKDIPTDPVIATQEVSQALTTAAIQAGTAYVKSQQAKTTTQVK